MKAIWKFPLKIQDEQKVRIPKGYRILSVHTQNNAPAMWAEVDRNADMGDVDVVITPTGGCPPDDTFSYIGTALTHNEGLVWHIYVR